MRALVARLPKTILAPTCTLRNRFSTSALLLASNRVYTSVRNPSDLSSYLLLSRSSSQPLITLWTASWCSPCHTILPLLTQLIENEKIGGMGPRGVAFAEVELDAPDLQSEDLAGRYMITSVPTLLAFSRGEAQLDTRVTDLGRLRDKKFLVDWIEKEAERAGKGGAGGITFGNWFGGGSA